jgi:RNA polymerase sigma-70 factor (ECF subfamily)
LHDRRSDGIATEHEVRLVEGYLAGEEDSFRLVESWIRREIQRRYADREEEQEELCQQVHEKLVACLRGGRFQHRSLLRTYVTSVAHHTCIDRLRQKYLHRIDEIPEDLPSSWGNPYRELEANRTALLLHRILHLSPESCRQLWRMILLERLSYREVGRRLGIPAGTVKSRAYYCRRKAMSLARQLGGRTHT